MWHVSMYPFLVIMTDTGRKCVTVKTLFIFKKVECVDKYEEKISHYKNGKTGLGLVACSSEV